MSRKAMDKSVEQHRVDTDSLIPRRLEPGVGPTVWVANASGMLDRRHPVDLEILSYRASAVQMDDLRDGG